MNDSKLTIRGELTLIVIIIINSLGVVLILHSCAGISAISSVPYAFSEVFPKLTLGTWTYLFQSLLILTLMVLRKKFIPEYLFSFVIGFFFGKMVDIHQAWVSQLPYTIPLRVVYFVLSYLIICFGIALSNRCKMPIIPTDLFPRELADILRREYSKIKVPFDVICLFITGFMTFLCLGHIMGLGVGTVLAAFTMGKVIGIIGKEMDKKVQFISIMKS